MRGKWFKRAAGVGLVLAVAVGLCGCGGKKNENAGLAKENVYRLQSVEFPELGGDEYGVRASAHVDGNVHLVVQVYHWDGSGDEIDLKLISIKDDASDVRLTDLEMPPKDKIDPGDLPDSGQDGDTAADDEDSAEGAETEEAADTDDADETDDADSEEGEAEDVEGKYEEGSNIWEHTNYYNYCFSPEGSIYALKGYYYEDYSDPENYFAVDKTYICCWNVDGSLRWQHEVGEFATEDEWVYLNTMVTGADGTLYLVLSGDKSYKISMDEEGNMSERIPVPEDIDSVLNNGSFFQKEDGSMLVMYWDEDWTKQYLVTYDIATDAVGEPALLPSNFSWNGYNTMCAGTESDLIFSNSMGVFTYNIGEEDSVKKMDFINSDLLNPSFNAVIELGGTSFFGVFSENYSGQPVAGIFNYVNPEDIPDKSVLVVAGNYVYDSLKQRVVEYNRTNEEYRIVVKEYNSYNSYEDYEAGYTKLNNDIVSGNMPDILITDGLPMENYASKGLLADIGKMIEEDEELSQVEFVQNVFDAYSVDGKLYYIIPYFNVGTMLAKTSLVGDSDTWTMAQAQKVLETMPEGAKLMGDITRSDFFNSMMQYCGGDFIDVDTGKCDFNTQDFMEMMEYAKTLSEEYEDDMWDYMSYQTQYRENRTLLCRFNFGSLKSLTYTINGRFGEDVTYIGFPTDSGSGSYINASESYAISSRSAHADAAWDFMRYYLTDEYQSDLDWSMPTQKKYFMEFAQTAMERPYWTDDEGNKTYYDQTYYMNGEEIILPPLSQEQFDKALEFVFSIDKCYFTNNDILNIINEEMDGYYSGQKTAEAVAQVIQSRAQVYVDANR